MRFIENGPSIPDALLRARDEGRVVFFCGAGVSRARAGLPDFFGLAESVIQMLGVPPEGDACKVLQKAREIGKELDLTGLISADRVFSLLERDFTKEDIETAVAKRLSPSANVDRSAHETLIRLARTSSGTMQLVTTNLDRLFESDIATLPVFQPPRLPHLSRYDDLNGIVYLHGRVNSDYTGADGHGFVLSSSDFGHAYLSEGWATEFFREIVRDFVVVFVGYSADDPPVHYLLEGLRRSVRSLNGIYAFQSDESTELIARWQHKGVTSIPYSAADEHRSLWATLEQWAIRAADSAQWQQSVLNRAKAGPRDLPPHERGQVAHIVSTHDGARAFALAKPPAEWLCVFDPRCRYERLGRLDWMDPNSPTIDPFSLYGLDHDEIPQRRGNDNFTRDGDIPNNAWDAFAISDLDQQDLSPENFAAFRGHRAASSPALPMRLHCIASWIATVANQPTAVWWAARQDVLHPSFRRAIEVRMLHPDEEIEGSIQNLWSNILEAWNNPPKDARTDWYDLKRELERDGWSSAGARRFVKLFEPYLKVGPGLRSDPMPPTLKSGYRPSDLARVEVECPVPPHDAAIPDEWLHHIVRGLRQNLDAAARLCEEVNDYNRFHISPIAEDDSSDISDYQRTHGLSGCVILFASLYERQVKVDVQAAKQELAAWPLNEDTAFARLRLWASGKPQIATPDEFAQVVLALTDNVFWDSYHQRDLLIVLAARWAELKDLDRQHIENRIRRGPSSYEGENEDEHRERLTWAVLERLQWLRSHVCEFSFDVENEIAKRRPDAPNWKPEFAERAAESREIRGGFVERDTESTALVREPLRTLLSKARASSGWSDTGNFKENDPFAGLCAENPKRAYLALAYAAKRNEFPIWAWNTFLNSKSRENDSSAFAAIIATRLCRVPANNLSQLLYSATAWLQTVSQAMSTNVPIAFDQIMQRFIDMLKADPNIGSSIVRDSGRTRDWVMEAINSPVGHLIRAVFSDVRVSVSGSIDARLTSITQCLSLPGHPRQHAIAVASHHLAWLHSKAPDWTEQNLINILDTDADDDKGAFWAGVFWNPQISSPALYLLIKDGLLAVAKDRDRSREGHAQSLAALLMTGWVSRNGNDGHRWVDSSEFRDVLLHGSDELRSHVLWQFERELRNENATDRAHWQQSCLEFFEAVWPRQRSVKTSEMTARICDVLVATPESFAKLIDVVSPLLTTIRDATRLHFHFRGEVKNLIHAHPKRFLHLLSSVLPDDIRHWPYEIGEALDMIVNADSSLLGDDRLRELRHKWSAS